MTRTGGGNEPTKGSERCVNFSTATPRCGRSGACRTPARWAVVVSLSPGRRQATSWRPVCRPYGARRSRRGLTASGSGRGSRSERRRRAEIGQALGAMPLGFIGPVHLRLFGQLQTRLGVFERLGGVLVVAGLVRQDRRPQVDERHADAELDRSVLVATRAEPRHG